MPPVEPKEPMVLTIPAFRGIHRSLAPHLREAGMLDYAMNLWGQNGALRLRHGLTHLGSTLDIMTPPAATYAPVIPDYEDVGADIPITEPRVVPPTQRPQDGHALFGS